MAISNATIPERRVALSADLLRRRPEAGELVVHALAQLSDDVTAQLPSEFAERAKVELLASAYGVAERLSFGATAPEESLFDRLAGGDVTFGELIEKLSDGEDVACSIRGGDAIFRGHRVAVVTNVPAHYRVPLLNAVSSRLELAGARFRAFFCARSSRSRPWLEGTDLLDFEHEFLRTIAVPVRARPPLVPLTIEAGLNRFRPTVVLAAGFSPAVSGRVARCARRASIPFGVWSGEHAQMHTARSSLRALQRRRLLARTDFAIAYGSASARYLRTLAPALPTVIGRNTGPLPNPMNRASSAAKPLEVVAIGDLADERKGIDVAIDAIRTHPDLDCRLTVIGGGATLSALRAKASGDRRIDLAGAKTAEETRRVVGAADIFLFPTRADIFGLALVEAMGAGASCVVSSVAGAVPDVCVDRVNCLLLEGHQTDAWANALAELISNSALRDELGMRARATILRRWTITHAADAMTAGVRLALLKGAEP